MMMIERPPKSRRSRDYRRVITVGVASPARGEKTKAEAGGAYR
jgi:hypothetical protein